MHRYPYGENELYHLGDDPNEKNNLINHEDIVEIRSSLQADMEQWFYEYRDREKDARIEEVWGIGKIGPVGLQAKGERSFR